MVNLWLVPVVPVILTTFAGQFSSSKHACEESKKASYCSVVEAGEWLLGVGGSFLIVGV